MDYFGKTPVEVMQEQQIKDLEREVRELRYYINQETVPGVDIEERDLSEMSLNYNSVTLPLMASVGLVNSPEDPVRLRVRGVAGNLVRRNLKISYYADARELQDVASQSRVLAHLHEIFIKRLAKDLHERIQAGMVSKV